MVQNIRMIKVTPNPASLAEAAAEQFAGLVRSSITEGSRFSVALSGGTTPRQVYSLLASKAYSDLDWSRVHLFWGDERCVPPSSPDSNYRMVCETLIDHISIPSGNIHRIRGEVPVDQAAEAYERELRTFFAYSGAESMSNIRRSFDLVLLGLGEDGHTASLFPGEPALQVRDRWSVAVPHDRPPLPQVDRVSLTLPAINAAAQVVFLVEGAKKAERLKQALSSPSDPQRSLPAQLVQPSSGGLLWLIDEAAAGGSPASEL